MSGKANEMTWQRRTKGDAAAVALANRHYSRLRYGKQGKQVGPPGRLLVFVTADETALWVSHWPRPDLALDRLDSWRCVLFRNEGNALSSTLIREAMRETANVWRDNPRDGWITWVMPSEIRSTNPGYCFQCAGWTVDHTWNGSRKGLIRLRHE